MQVDLGPRAGRGEPPRPTWTAAGPERAVRPRRSLRHAGRRYLSEEGMEDPRVGPVFAAAVDVTICLTPVVWREWSLQGLDEQFFGGILGRFPQRWFRPVDV